MPPVQCFRKFVNERLTAAAEEIFRVFRETVVEYEAEIARQRKLLDMIWKDQVTLLRIEPVPPEVPQQHVCKEEEVLTDEWLCNQERNSSLDQEDQEDPELPQIKEDQEELCTSQEAEQLELKETDTFMLTPIYEESDHCKQEPESDHQLLSNNSLVAESQGPKGVKNGDSGSTEDAEPEPKKRLCKSSRCSKNVHNADMSEIDQNTHDSEKESLKCDSCGKDFEFKSQCLRHLRSHTGEKLYVCKTCRKRHTDTSAPKRHARIHTDEKPYLCKTCRKSFIDWSSLKSHITIHTGKKPFTCKTCGKDFRFNSALTVHMRTHTGEKPYSCNTCGKAFSQMSHLKKHTRLHAGDHQEDTLTVRPAHRGKVKHGGALSPVVICKERVKYKRKTTLNIPKTTGL